jgi:hypothetical protein
MSYVCPDAPPPNTPTFSCRYGPAAFAAAPSTAIPSIQNPTTPAALAVTNDPTSGTNLLASWATPVWDGGCTLDTITLEARRADFACVLAFLMVLAVMTLPLASPNPVR